MQSVHQGNVAQKLVRELNEFFVVFLIVAPFVISLTLYRRSLGCESGGAFFQYGAALINALVLSKVILIGNAIGLGKASENRSLIISVLCKAAVFALFYLAFHLVESGIEGMVHGQHFSSAVRSELLKQKGQHIARTSFVFFAFIPFFALFEVRRKIGHDKFRNLFLIAREPAVNYS